MRFLGFVLKIALLVALVLWLADRPGTAQIVWRDTVIETSAAVLGVMVAAIAYIFVLLHKMWRFVVDGPRFWRLRRTIGQMENGQKEVALSFAALSAGMGAEAGRHAVKARKALGETPITRLLLAQAAQLSGDQAVAARYFEEMTRDPETAMMGYRGLIAAALRRGDDDEALRLVARCDAPAAKAPWLDLVRFQIEARREHWDLARESLSKVQKAKALPKSETDRYEAALLLGRAKQFLRNKDFVVALEEAETARKLARDWLPAALVLAEAQIFLGHERAALRTLDKAWAIAPHQPIGRMVEWAMRARKSIDVYRHLEKSIGRQTANRESLTVLAEAALRAELWGEARRQLMMIHQDHVATRGVYQMLARLEQKERNDEREAARWMALALTAPPDEQWICRTCGATHEYWEAHCVSCQTMDSLDWIAPGRARKVALSSSALALDGFAR